MPLIFSEGLSEGRQLFISLLHITLTDTDVYTCFYNGLAAVLRQNWPTSKLTAFFFKWQNVTLVILTWQEMNGAWSTLSDELSHNLLLSVPRTRLY